VEVKDDIGGLFVKARNFSRNTFHDGKKVFQESTTLGSARKVILTIVKSEKIFVLGSKALQNGLA
jgi:hypothetical protein